MKPTSTVVEAARACPLLTRAHALAAFVGAGRPVTAKAGGAAELLAECGAIDPHDPHCHAARVLGTARVRPAPRAPG